MGKKKVRTARPPDEVIAVNRGGRPVIEIDMVQLRAIMRFKPTLADTAAFFSCSTSKIENVIQDEFNLTFSEFRDQNMVHTRFNLIRTAIQKAEKGDNCMLIFCLKNLCNWRDKYEEESVTAMIDVSRENVIELCRIAREETLKMMGQTMEAAKV